VIHERGHPTQGTTAVGTLPLGIITVGITISMGRIGLIVKV
jgi:hypothetical protein